MQLTMKIKTILVPTDFSKEAANALLYAAGLATDEHARIILLHVWDIDYPAIDVAVPENYISTQQHDLELNAIIRMKPLCHKISSEYAVSCDQLNRQGNLVKVISKVVKEENIDLVIMGTKGASGLKEILTGTNTVRVLQKSDCPVLAIPPKAKYAGLKRITYATDYLSSDFTTLKKLVHTARIFGSGITLLHVAGMNEQTQSAKAMVEEYAARVKKKVRYGKLTYKLVQGNDLEELDNYVKRKRTDLLVMSGLHRTFIDKLLSKSHTKAMAFHTTIPLMVFYYREKSIIFLA